MLYNRINFVKHFLVNKKFHKLVYSQDGCILIQSRTEKKKNVKTYMSERFSMYSKTMWVLIDKLICS